MEREAMKGMANGLTGIVRAAFVTGVYIGATESMMLAGFLTIVVVAIDALFCLDDAVLFGQRQWSITITLVAIGVFSVIINRSLKQRYDTDDDVNNTSDEPSESPASEELFVVLALACLISFAWLFVMGWFCFMAGKMDDAGFGVAEVVAVEILAMTFLWVILYKICVLET